MIGKTGIGLNRGEEILEFIDTNDLYKYVVVDDQVKDILIHISDEKVVKIDPKIGFEDDGLVDKALDILL